MRSTLAVLTVALVGLFGATSIGYAAYVVSRDSVGLPVTKLKLSPDRLAPPRVEQRVKKPVGKKTATTRRTTTGDDHGGRRTTTRDDHSGSGKSRGSDDSGHGDPEDD